MRWYEYKMETDDLCAPEDLKAKLLAMTDQLTEEEKNQPMMKTPAPARPAPVQRKKPVRFPVKRVGTLAACLAVCAVGYGAFATGMIGLGAKSSSRRPIIRRTALWPRWRQAAWTAPLWTAPWPPITA